jgi:hypothetical protein
MKKVTKKRTELPMRSEYDFSKGVVGKYAARYAAGTNVVLLDRDLARIFPDSQAVNDALRRLVKSSTR